ncbi:MAG TPA: tail fiber domain-containing protein, partial [Anaerolineales bacterium]
TASQGAATVGGGFENTASGNRTTVGGGQGNTAGGSWTTVGGGIDNATSGNASTVGGGASNEASADRATVGGGENNMASGDRSTVGGGYGNRASGSHAAVGGGRINAATAIFAIVTGGYANAATGVLSWAGGRRAKARHRGAYVWADATNANFASTAPNQYNVRAAGGVRIFSNVAATVGVRLLPGSNAWSIASDRALKEDFRDVDKQQVLEGVQQLTIQEWKLKEQEGNIRHIGPIAQEFRAAFGVGSDERLINSGDAIGVALVAIQALAERVEGLVAQNTALQAHVQELQTQLEAQASSARKAEEGGVLRAAYGGFRVHEE